MATNLNTLEKDQLLRIVSRLEERARKLERILQGVPIGTVRIDSLSVSKLVSGILNTNANLGEENIQIDGVNHRILINDGSYDRILIGDFGDGTYGIKVSQIGKDVKTCEDFDLIMSSELNTLKTLWSGELGPNDSQVHGLGYIPITLYAQYTGDKINYLSFIGQEDENYILNFGWITTDTTETHNENNSGFGNPIKVFVFYDPMKP